MRAVGTSAFVVLLACSAVVIRPGVSQTAEITYPHAFPREGARQVLNNPWGTAWDATWAPDRPTVMHRHMFDFISIELTDSAVAVMGLDGERRTVPLSRGKALFQQRGVTHIEEGLSHDPPRHAVVLDLKDAPATAVPTPSGAPLAYDAEGASRIADNTRVTIWDYTWPAAGPDAAAYAHERSAFVVVLDGGELTSVDSRQKQQVRTVSSGQTMFWPGGETYSMRSTKGAVRAIVVELK